MTADVVDQPTSTTPPSSDPVLVGSAAAGPTSGAGSAGAGPSGSGATGPGSTAAGATGTDAAPAANEIRGMRERIDQIDQAIIDLWLERARLSQQVGKTRMASGGTRLVLSREREIVERFREALGPDGTQVALLLLRSGRGPL